MSMAPSKTTNTSGPSLTCQTYGAFVQCSRTVASSKALMPRAPHAVSAVCERTSVKRMRTPRVGAGRRVGQASASGRQARRGSNRRLRVVLDAAPHLAGAVGAGQPGHEVQGHVD